MNDPTKPAPRGVAGLPEPERPRLFASAMADRDWSSAEALAAGPLPPEWPEDMRRAGGGRRDMARQLRRGEGA